MVNIESIKNTELKPIAIWNDLFRVCLLNHVKFVNPEHDTRVSISTGIDTLISFIPSTCNDTIAVREVCGHLTDP